MPTNVIGGHRSYRGRLQTLGGRGVYGNDEDVDTGEEYRTPVRGQPERCAGTTSNP